MRIAVNIVGAKARRKLRASFNGKMPAAAAGCVVLRGERKSLATAGFENQEAETG